MLFAKASSPFLCRDMLETEFPCFGDAASASLHETHAKLERACETFSHARPAKSNATLGYAAIFFSPVIGFRDSIPFSDLAEVEIWTMELARHRKNRWPMRSPPSQLSSMNRMTEV